MYIFAPVNDKKKSLLDDVTGVFMEHGIKRVTMEDLSKQLGVSKKTFYKYFKDKEELVFEIVKEKVLEDQEQCIKCRSIAQDAMEELLLVIESVLQQFKGINLDVFSDLKRYYPRAWKLLDEHQRGFIQKMMLENLKRGVLEGLYREEVDKEIISRLYVVSIHAMINGEVFPLTEFEFEKLFKEIVWFHLHGLATEKGRKKIAHRI